MSYIPFENCGVYGANGKRIRTKKALREELATHLSEVYFDTTSMFAKVNGYQGNEIPEGITLSVVMPCPYTERRVYASVTRKPDGTLKVA